MKRICWLALAASAAFGQTPSIGEIMSKVAANQDRSVDARKQFVYRQEELVALRRTNGKTECQVDREYTITPGAGGSVRKLVNAKEVMGHCDDDIGSNVTVNIDHDTADVMHDSLGHEKDGIPRDLFPLTVKEQQYYDYRLAGTENYRGRRVYRIRFEPKRQQPDGESGDWKGEALIDAEEFQPVVVNTDLAGKVPLAVRVFLGTNVRGLGFSVSYQRVAEGVWFPASFGGEFKLNVLFFYRRSISINVKNSDFKRTDVNSKVAYDGIQ